MIKIYDKEIYKHSDSICLKCEYEICGDCKLLNTNYANTDDKEFDIDNGESD